MVVHSVGGVTAFARAGAADDASWFRANPGRLWRLRRPLAAEVPVFGRVTLLVVNLPRGVRVRLSAPPRTFLLDGLIAPREFSVWWGAPKCGKSFLLLRVSYGLALGRGMWGRFGARLAALVGELGDAGDRFRVIAQRPTVGPPAGDLEDVIEAARDMGVALIVLDTLARTFGEGDESATRDMNGFAASVDRIREETGAHVAVVHHGPRSGERPRGSVALDAAADLIVKVAKGADGSPSLATVEAAKDDADGAELPFRLRVVDEPRRTCIAEEADADEARPGRDKPLSPRQRTAIAFLNDVLAREGERAPPAWGLPADVLTVPLARWQAECDARHLYTSDSPKNRRDVFNREAATPRDRGFVAMRDGRVWVVP